MLQLIGNRLNRIETLSLTNWELQIGLQFAQIASIDAVVAQTCGVQKVAFKMMPFVLPFEQYDTVSIGLKRAPIGKRLLPTEATLLL